MTPTIEQIKEILAGAPDGDYLGMLATHYDKHNGDYFIMWVGSLSGVHSHIWDGRNWVEDELSKPTCPVSLECLRTILAQHEEVERLKAQQSEVSARAVESAAGVCKLTVLDGPDIYSEALSEYANQLREQGDEL